MSLGLEEKNNFNTGRCGTVSFYTPSKKIPVNVTYSEAWRTRGSTQRFRRWTLAARDMAHTRHITGDGTGRDRSRLSGNPGTPINANQIESREYEAYSQIKRIKAS